MITTNMLTKKSITLSANYIHLSPTEIHLALVRVHYLRNNQGPGRCRERFKNETALCCSGVLVFML